MSVKNPFANILNLFTLGYKRIRGEIVFCFQIFGIKLLMVTKRDEWHRNIFILYIPILQIVTEAKRYSIDILPLVWIFKCIKYLFTKWQYIRLPEKHSLSFCGRNIYQWEQLKPYCLPLKTSHDKQVER